MLKKYIKNRSIKSISALLSASTLVLAAGFSQPALAFDPYLGEIETFGFNFAPRGWAFCDGQILPITQNTALFSLLGTTYGGDGRIYFCTARFARACSGTCWQRARPVDNSVGPERRR